MLVLTRKHQEKIRIGDNITITILKTKGKAVRVGIEAPDNVSVVRGELVANQSEEFVTAIAGTEATANRRTRRNMPIETTWSTDSRPTSDETSRRQEPVMEVSLQRVSRKDAAKLLPRLASDVGPLRSMLQRRATV